MIQNIRHNGLARLYTTGSTRGLTAAMVPRLKMALTLLDVASSPDDVAGAATPGQRFHPLVGEYAGYYAFSITGNWRVVFRFEGENVADLDLVDYH